MKFMKRRKKIVRAGTAAVEFAIVCPLLMMLALACADFGRVCHCYQVVANAARAGAELGASRSVTDLTRADWEAEIQSAVTTEMQNLAQFDEGKFDYSLTTSVDAHDLLHVVIEVSYQFNTAVNWPLVPDSADLVKQIEFVQFR
jgi:Flp pilus assembly protein TadG